MNLYPALTAKMGSWDYYIVKMKMRELANEVMFASEVYDDKTLDLAIQRSLNEGRVKKEIVSYLIKRDDRFFSSVVVAALGGKPQFYPVRITDDERFQLFQDQGLDQSFGVLTFSGEQQYYALDGQHRLKAIKTLLDPKEPSFEVAPPGIADEEVSVLMVVRQEADATFLRAYRRLFSSLNRYAKATDKDTNIIMDEDDVFAILTRRLISEYDFFKWEGRQKESQKVKTKGKNLNSKESYFTSLQTLYAMNETLLSSAWRANKGWGGVNGEAVKDKKLFIQFRPDEDYIDSLYSELETYWDALLEVLPDFKKEPTKMRVHNLDIPKQQESTDSLLFWPIGQELLVRVTRRLMNKKLQSEQTPSKENVIDVIKVLEKIDWRLHSPPWRYFLLIYDEPKDSWKMRNEERNKVVDICCEILLWLLRDQDLDKDALQELKIEWQTRLVPAQDQKIIDEMWRQICDMRV